VLTTPFGVYFDVEIPPVPLEPLPNNVIWRPMVSNWMTTPYNEGEADPRAFSLVHPGADWFFPEDVGIITRSNFSSLDFGFVDPNDGPPRALEFYFAPYGYDFEDATMFGTGAPLAPGTATTYINVVRGIKGGFTDTINADQGVHVIWELTPGQVQVLEPGAYNLFVRVVHGAGEYYDLVQAFPFVVTNERPTIDLDYETFYFEEGDEYVTITGSVSSLGHDLALEHNLLFRPVDGTIDAVLDYTHTQLLLGGVVAGPVNPDGTFSFNVPAEDAELDLRVIEGVGQVILPFLGVFWMAEPASTHISYFYDFTVAEEIPCDYCEYCGECQICSECPDFSLRRSIDANRIIIGFNSPINVYPYNRIPFEHLQFEIRLPDGTVLDLDDYVTFNPVDPIISGRVFQIHIPRAALEEVVGTGWQYVRIWVSRGCADAEILVRNPNPFVTPPITPPCIDCDEYPCVCPAPPLCEDCIICPACGDCRICEDCAFTLLGDTNGDGVVDADDLALLSSFVRGINVEINLCNADVNGDGVVNMADVMALMALIRG
jgi:hypothetical protein